MRRRCLLQQLVRVCFGLALADVAIGCGQNTSTFAAFTPAPSRSGNTVLLRDGATLSTNMIAQACNGTTPGNVVLPTGLVTVVATLVIPSRCTIQGQGTGVSTMRLLQYNFEEPGDPYQFQAALESSGRAGSLYQSDELYS
jgi:hypothetical protein